MIVLIIGGVACFILYKVWAFHKRKKNINTLNEQLKTIDIQKEEVKLQEVVQKEQQKLNKAKEKIYGSESK